MSIINISNPTFLHASQIDALYTIYNSTQIKAFFDSQATGIISDVNTKIVTVLNSTTSGSSGSENVGSPTIGGLTGTTVYSQLNSVPSNFLSITNTTAYTPTLQYHPSTKGYTDSSIAGVVLGQIPDGTITPAKLSFDPATQAELDAVQEYICFMDLRGTRRLI